MTDIFADQLATDQIVEHQHLVHFHSVLDKPAPFGASGRIQHFHSRIFGLVGLLEKVEQGLTGGRGGGWGGEGGAADPQTLTVSPPPPPREGRGHRGTVCLWDALSEPKNLPGAVSILGLLALPNQYHVTAIRQPLTSKSQSIPLPPCLFIIENVASLQGLVEDTVRSPLRGQSDPNYDGFESDFNLVPLSNPLCVTRRSPSSKSPRFRGLATVHVSWLPLPWPLVIYHRSHNSGKSRR